MTDVHAGIEIKKGCMDYYHLDFGDYGFTLTSDEDGVAFPIYEYNKSTIERFKQYNYGEKFQHFINSLLDINSEKYYVCIC